MTTIKHSIALALNLPTDEGRRKVVDQRNPQQSEGDIGNEIEQSKVAQPNKPAKVDLSVIKGKLISDDLLTQQAGLRVLRPALLKMSQSMYGKTVNILIQCFNSKQCKIQNDVIDVLNDVLPRVDPSVRAEALSNLANDIGSPMPDEGTQEKTMVLIHRNFPAVQKDVTVRFFNGLILRDLARAVGDPNVSKRLVEPSIDFIKRHISAFCAEDDRKIVMQNLKDIVDDPNYDSRLSPSSKKKLMDLMDRAA